LAAFVMKSSTVICYGEWEFVSAVAADWNFV